MEYIKRGAKISLIMMILCGGIYSIVTLIVGQVFFPYQANGSIIEVDGEEVGSELIGQRFSSEKYFISRIPSAPNYNIGAEKKASGSENLSINSEEFRKRVENDIDNFLKENPTVNKEEISLELICESGSGLDPHISVKGAQIQVNRINKATNISKEKLLDIIEKNTEKKFLGVFGEERVNVLKLNLAIDEILKEKN
ncbi:MAG: potassium-transporting ATPase subunit KdpC [Sarcina sp.]